MKGVILLNYLILGDPSGSHCLRLIEAGVHPSSITVWEDTAKGQFCVRRRGCQVTDNLEDLNKMRFDVVIGNPPYGNGGNLAIQFLNKCGDLSDDIRLILPLSVRKASALNKIRKDFICIEDERLPDDTFYKGIHTVRQRWIKTDQLRETIQTHKTHPDFEFCHREDPEANLFIMRVGYAGRVLTEESDFKEYRSSSTGHFFLKVKDQSVIDRLVRCEPEFRRVAEETNGMNVLSKHELISIYIEHST